MFFLKLMTALVAGSFLLASCTLEPPVRPVPTNPQSNGQPGQPAQPAGEKVLTPEEEKLRQERIRANREAAKRRAAREAEKKKQEPQETTTESTDPVVPPKRELIEPSKKLRVATPIPGKPGYVFNPWTLKPVDVRGIPSGSKIRDPKDGDPNHIFLVP